MEKLIEAMAKSDMQQRQRDVSESTPNTPELADANQLSKVSVLMLLLVVRESPPPEVQSQRPLPAAWDGPSKTYCCRTQLLPLEVKSTR